ncbi:MAG: hypothetical protein PCFJNLEI_00963 [Verrucomicrobiae bacterium]|nr:hypothetical protein [Verrucomicrobiae bacterium]
MTVRVLALRTLLERITVLLLPPGFWLRAPPTSIAPALPMTKAPLVKITLL